MKAQFLDTSRHTDYYDPLWHLNSTAAIIGCGSIGSNIAPGLAALSFPNLVLIDADKVGAENLSNQRFTSNQIGMFKCLSVAAMCGDKYPSMILDPLPAMFGPDIKSKMDRVSNDVLRRLRFDVVIVATDDIASRRTVIEAVRMNRKTRLFIDARMTATQATVYAFDPEDPALMKRYFETLHREEDVPSDAGGCGINQSIGATASTAADIALWQFIHWTRDRQLSRIGDERKGAFHVTANLLQFRMIREPV